MTTDTPATTEQTLTLRLSATVARPGRRGQSWTVEAGEDLRRPWRAEGPSRQAATGALAQRLQAFIDRYREPLILTFAGHTSVVSLHLGDEHNPMVWTERIVSPSGVIAHSGFPADSWAQAEAQARYTLAQHCYDPHDDDSVHAAVAYVAAGPQGTNPLRQAEDLYRYAAWQRAARQAITDKREDWHQWAWDHAEDYAIPRPQQAPQA